MKRYAVANPNREQLQVLRSRRSELAEFQQRLVAEREVTDALGTLQMIDEVLGQAGTLTAMIDNTIASELVASCPDAALKSKLSELLGKRSELRGKMADLKTKEALAQELVGQSTRRMETAAANFKRFPATQPEHDKEACELATRQKTRAAIQEENATGQRQVGDLEVRIEKTKEAMRVA